MRRSIPLLLLCTLFYTLLFGQTPQDAAIPVQANAGINPPAIVLTWPNPSPAHIKLSRRLKGADGNSWVVLYDEANSFKNGHLDVDALTAGATYEYEVERIEGAITAYGYAQVSIFRDAPDFRGKILVFIDSTTADALGTDLKLFKDDLRGEGWQTVPNKTGPSTTVQWVKNKIISAYNADPTGVKAVLLIGAVPVPYSGSIAWDNKPDHTGAWPCDAYYGDIDGIWTDNIVNIPSTARPANRNVPGDSKFDQNTFPSAIELPVGRLDFRHLSTNTFGTTPIELLRKYLYKNHYWRNGQYTVQQQAIVDDNLGWAGGAAFAADGYRNAYPLTGAYQVIQGDFLNQTNPQTYLLGYGAGSSGTYTSLTGVGSSSNFANDTLNMVFAQVYGDYVGDWDYESNPLMPALLASKGAVLACAWAGKPHWFLQALASGEPIGTCLKETQNAQYNSAYGSSANESSVPIALLGDPTLRAQVVLPATNLTAVSNCNKVNLHWSASPDPDLVGYLVYRSQSLDGPYARVSPELLHQTDWADLTPVADTLFYAVRAIALQVTPGGGAFYEASTSKIANVVFVPGAAPTVLGLGGNLNCNTNSLVLGVHLEPSNCTYQWYKPNGSPLSGSTATENGVYTVISTAPNGCTAIAYATVTLDTSLPVLNLPAIVTVTCANPNPVFVAPPAPNGVIYTQDGVEIFPGQEISLLTQSVFMVHSNLNGCTKSYAVQVVLDTAQPAADASSDGNVLGCSHPTVQLFGNASPSNVTYAWMINNEISNIPNPVVSAPGYYCLTVTAANGCSSTDCVAVMANGTVVSLQIQVQGNPCLPGSTVTLTANPSGGQGNYQYNWSTGATASSYTVPSNFTGNIGLTVTDANGCTASSSYSAAVAPTLLAQTTKASTPSSSDGNIDLLVLGGLAPFSFLWSNGSTSEDLTGVSSGIYTVTVTSANGCTSTLTVPLITVGTEEASLLSKVYLAPNPAQDQVGVFLDQQVDQLYNVRLLDLTGRLLSAQRGSAKVFYFDTADIAPGLYLLAVETNQETKTFKLTVVK